MSTTSNLSSKKETSEVSKLGSKILTIEKPGPKSAATEVLKVALKSAMLGSSKPSSKSTTIEASNLSKINIHFPKTIKPESAFNSNISLKKKDNSNKINDVKINLASREKDSRKFMNLAGNKTYTIVMNTNNEPENVNDTSIISLNSDREKKTKKDVPPVVRLSTTPKPSKQVSAKKKKYPLSK